MSVETVLAGIQGLSDEQRDVILAAAAAEQDTLSQILSALTEQTTTLKQGVDWMIARAEAQEVTPIRPVPIFTTVMTLIPGIAPADALDADDAMGTVFGIRVPISGIIQSATFYDYDNEATEVDLVIAREVFTGAASDAAFAILDSDLHKIIYQIEFSTFENFVNGQISSVENIGKAYSGIKPESPGSAYGTMYCQAVCRGTPTIAAGANPGVQLEILPDR